MIYDIYCVKYAVWVMRYLVEIWIFKLYVGYYEVLGLVRGINANYELQDFRYSVLSMRCSL